MHTCNVFLGIMPWVWEIGAFWGWLNSRYYILDEADRIQFFSIATCGAPILSHKLSKYMYTLTAIAMICIILFASIGDALDFEKEGFFSYSGKSQYLLVLLLITFEFQALLMIIMGCKFNKHMEFLKRHVRDRRPSD